MSAVGRNQPCPCGSGRKYKRCCSSNERAKGVTTLSSDQNKNPLNMYQLEEGGIFVLPPTPCSRRRAEFLARANATLGYFAAISISSKEGRDVLARAEKQGKFGIDTTFKLDLGTEEGELRFNYGLYKKWFARAGDQLSNQIFLMLYGSFEALVSDLVFDALQQSGSYDDPYQETLNLMALSKWRGKIDRIDSKMQVGLGKHLFVDKFQDIEMGILGEQCDDPRKFLEIAADLRNRLVHSVGRADAGFVDTYPESGLSVGDEITIPARFLFPLQFFFTHLSDVFDEAFSSKFGWPRVIQAPESLTG